MKELNILRENIFKINNRSDFEAMALELFEAHYHHNLVYRKYCDLLKINPKKINHSDNIPFLPIQFFKTQTVALEGFSFVDFFKSSGTTSEITSKHHIVDFGIYDESLLKGFEHFFGNPQKYCFLSLLPNYLEQGNSSLIYMIEKLNEASGHPENGFYLNNQDELLQTLQRLEKQGQPTILFGVTYALLDLTEKAKLNLNHTTVFETGGMKGRRKEMVREELHALLCERFGVASIYSEYGMTELFSQAYSSGNGIYNCPPWMKILIRETNNPLQLAKDGATGGINVIDFANLYSCPFIATQDLGKLRPDGKFEVLGRFDNSDVRGCNLMVSGL